MDILEKVSATVKKHNMLQRGDAVLVGLSGGPDSACLLTVLNKLPLALKLHVAYIDHGLRPQETPSEIEFCRTLCGKLDIPFQTKFIDVKSFAAEKKLNKQEAARILRYFALEEIAAGIKAKAIALGHNLNDNVETLLMRLIRGAGAKGLSAIPPVRGAIIRPLIETSRGEIENYLKTNDIVFIVDSSNLKNDYLRNKIRTSLIPALRKFNPNILDTLSHAVEVFREEDRFLDIAVTKAMMKLFTNKTDKTVELFMAPLEIMDRVILRRALRRALEETRGLRGIGFVHIEDVIKLIKTGKPGDRLYLPKGIRVIKKYATVVITSEPPAHIGTYQLNEVGDLPLPEARLLLSVTISAEKPTIVGSNAAVFDADKAAFPLTVRARRPGDYFYPHGFGKKKKLQDFFVDEKIPRDERDAIPILVCGDDIVWVAGMRGDERFKPSEKTVKFLVAELTT